MQVKPVTVSAQNQWSKPLAGNPDKGDILATVGAGSTSTASVRYLTSGDPNTDANWTILPTTYAAATSFNIIPVRDVLYSIGVATGDFVDGITLELAQ